MEKYIIEANVIEKNSFEDKYCLLKLTAAQPFPDMRPGQFVQARINAASVFLRRPISINFMDKEKNVLGLLIQLIGNGTRALAEIRLGDKLNLILPLGNHFNLTPHSSTEAKLLLVGGGVGMAPLLFLGSYLKNDGYEPIFLLGAKNKCDLVQLKDFQKFGTVYASTEDGSYGEKGLLTQHSILKHNSFDQIYACGPKPMMLAVAKYAAANSFPCEVSLENSMACGIGACLCCVENTVDGNKCVCTDGPVFNINKLKWLI
ncbi:MAG: dihydroorotate dehydrogenase electron transfer subunit [Tannerellaceae bacterium]|jgi:dihydroorotate dehydrogenase electron transfer subunit|nr:dihydroorotate dehydrogenase electron transfer subunit [Tannerellaceae bacterium]